MTTCADVTDCLLFRHLALFLGGVDLGNEDFMDYDREAHLCRLGVVLTRRVPAINFDLVRAWNRHELLLFLQT
jgi:hypothetical protein